MLKYWILAFATGLAACSTAPNDLPPVETLPVPTDDPVLADGISEDIDAEPYDPSKDLTLITCGAHETLDLVGTPVAQAMPRLPENNRIIRPGAVVTQDYDTSRMNVFVNESGTITKIDCG